MSLALPARPSLVARSGGWAARVPGWAWDAASLGALALLAAVLLVWRYDAIPLQLWDESRNANNALEVALGGHWLAPSFAGAPDHWNTKPPLLIWLMALGLKAGLPPLVALRLPSWGAAYATLGLVWSALRFGLKDRGAATVGGALLLSSLVYVGAHAARTGDFDALEALFVTGYVLSGWMALEGERAQPGWMLAVGACAALAVMTKGVAGLLAAPGLMLFALMRPRALLGVLKDWRTWAAAIAALAVCAGYYGLRERADPGYLRAVLDNEIGGRFLVAADNHWQPWHYYWDVLAAGFQPGLALLATGAASLNLGTTGPGKRMGGTERRRGGLVLAAGLGGLSLLLVLSAAKSKLDWYATPIIPLFALAEAVGAVDLLALVRRDLPAWAPAARAGLVATVTVGCAMALATNLTARTTSHGDLDCPQYGYARLFDRLEALRPARPVTVVDGGFPNDAGFKAYNPVLGFYALRARARGLRLDLRASDEHLAPGQLVASCDPSALEELGDDYRLSTRLTERACVLNEVISEK